MKLLAKRVPNVVTGPGGMLRLSRIAPPKLPGKDWVRVRPVLSGICGSDLATITGHSSIYLSAFTSFPFVPGHEVVGNVVEIGSSVSKFSLRDRVVLEPALGCDVRGFDQLCLPCQRGHYSNCERVTTGNISAGIQTGFCKDTGGGWGTELVAHETQLHIIPDNVTDEAAVMVEPLSCAIHGVLRASIPSGASILVVGSGTIGLLTIAAIKKFSPDSTITCTAKYAHQQDIARILGADHVIHPGHGVYKQLGEVSGGVQYKLPLGKPAVMGGFDITFECTGSRSGIEDSIRWTRSQGKVIISGMPSQSKMDLAPLWYQELQVIGAYTYSLENDHNMGSVKTFGLAIDMISHDRWGKHVSDLVRHRFGLNDHRKAIATAMRPGQTGSVKTVFEFTKHFSVEEAKWPLRPIPTSS